MHAVDLVLSWSLHRPQMKSPELIDFERCIHILLAFEQVHSLTPTHIRLRGKGYTDNGTMEFPTGLQELERNLFKNLTSVSITTAPPDSNDLEFYWEAKFHLSCSNILGTHCYVGVEVANNALKDDLFLKAIAPICQVFEPALGYAYMASAEEGPVAYAQGAVHTLEYDHLTQAQKELSFTWARNLDLVSSGKLRDLYQFNILSEPHLRYSIDGDSLETWITSDPGRRGVLTHLSNNNTLWTVPAPSYNQVRDRLFRSDMLIAYDKHIVPTLFLA